MLKNTKSQLHLSIILSALAFLIGLLAAIFPHSYLISNDIFQTFLILAGIIGPVGGYLYAEYKFKSKNKVFHNLEEFYNGCQFVVIDPQTPYGERGVVVKAMVKRKGKEKEFFVSINESSAVNGSRYLKTDDTLVELAPRKN